MLHAESRLLIKATPEVIWPIIADSVTWPTWAGCDSAAIERPSVIEPNGVGTIRTFTTGPVTVREEITAFEPTQRIAYTMLSGLPLKDYHAEMLLAPKDGGTELLWWSRFDPKIPGTGLPMKLFMQFILDSWGAALQKHVEAQVASR